MEAEIIVCMCKTGMAVKGLIYCKLDVELVMKIILILDQMKTCILSNNENLHNQQQIWATKRCNNI